LEDVIQRKVLGSDTSPSHWKLRWSRSADGAHQIEPIQEHNTTVRCMMNSISLLIESAFSNGDNEDKTKLILACSKYSQAIELLTAHRILTDEELDMFQELIDDFFSNLDRIIFNGRNDELNSSFRCRTHFVLPSKIQMSLYLLTTRVGKYE